MAKDKQIRMKSFTLKLVRIFAGELQMQSGDNVTDDMAVYEMFKLYCPDIIERLKEIDDAESDTSD